jgi:hypothetical protein
LSGNLIHDHDRRIFAAKKTASNGCRPNPAQAQDRYDNETKPLALAGELNEAE